MWYQSQKKEKELKYETAPWGRRFKTFSNRCVYKLNGCVRETGKSPPLKGLLQNREQNLKGGEKYARTDLVYYDLRRQRPRHNPNHTQRNAAPAY